MKIHRHLVRLLLCVICLGLICPLDFFEETAYAAKKRRRSVSKGTPQKGSTARSRGRRGRGRRSRGPSAAVVSRPSFDKVMSENRVLVNELTDAENAGT